MSAAAPHGPAILCLTPRGAAIGRRIAAAIADFGPAVHGRAGRVDAADVVFDDAVAHLRDLFLSGRPVIGVCAAGILIRALAPFLSDKTREPPVIAVAEDGSAVAPLLGGHRGANALARRVAAELDVPASVTTAGDLSLGAALDAPPPGWRLANPEAAGRAMADALAGAPTQVDGDAPWLAPLLSAPLPTDRSSTPNAAKTETGAGPVQVTVGETRLTYHPRRLALGVGCERGADPAELAALAAETLAAAGLSPAAVGGVFSLDLKADEAAVNALAQQLDAPVRFFDAARLEQETPRLATPSEVVFREVGCHGVAEAAALAGAGDGGRLVTGKRKSARATCAVAEAKNPLCDLPGRRRGRLHVVGVGPGDADARTPAATQAVASAEELIGYGLYIDLLGPLAAGKPRKDFPLGGEEDRCRYALERAGAGADVALICSGDGGIYAMGALVMELIDRGAGAGGVSDAARRAEIVMTPGVSALQAASARAGALIGHDFCAISLSDLLTPWETIERRIRGAAAGDFVIAFYNPVSRKRRTQLARARDILLAHRAADTPTLLATDLGRPGERLRRRTLGALDIDEVDMLTVVLVGSSQSRSVPSGDRAAGAEGAWLYTPRGYAAKRQA